MPVVWGSQGSSQVGLFKPFLHGIGKPASPSAVGVYFAFASRPYLTFMPGQPVVDTQWVANGLRSAKCKYEAICAQPCHGSAEDHIKLLRQVS